MTITEHIQKLMADRRERTAAEVSEHIARNGTVLGESLAADYLMDMVEDGDLISDRVGKTKTWRKGEEGQHKSLRLMIEEVAERHGFKPVDLRGPTRSRKLASARREAVIEANGLGFSSGEVGRALNRDPATVRGIMRRHHREAAE